MDEKEINIHERFQYYDNYIEYIDGHNDKSFVRIDDNSREFAERFSKSIENDSHKPEKRHFIHDALSSLFKLDIKQKKEIIGTSNIAQKTMQDSVVFRELFEAIQSGKSSYVTSINDIVSGEKDGKPYIPHYVPCLVKSCLEDCAYREVVGSRLGNALGVPVVYNTTQDDVVKDKSYVGSKVASKYVPQDIDVYSVDFVEYGYYFESLSRLGAFIPYDTPLETNLEIVLQTIKLFAKEHNIKFTPKIREKIERDFCKQYLFRDMLCEDLDCEAKNYGILYSIEKGYITLTPMFDLELMFNTYGSSGYTEINEKSIMFYHKKFPNDLADFMRRLEKLITENKLQAIFTETLPQEKYKDVAQRSLDMVHNNAVKMLVMYQEIRQRESVLAHEFK